MLLTFLKSKIHRVTVTEANIDYVGSITIDEELMDAAGLSEYEQVTVANIDNGNRLETYVIKGARGAGQICLNGAAAMLFRAGDMAIIMAYAQVTPEEAKTLRPKIVFVDEKNRIKELAAAERHGQVR